METDASIAGHTLSKLAPLYVCIIQQFGEARIQRYQPFPCDLDCLIADPLDALNAVVSILSQFM